MPRGCPSRVCALCRSHASLGRMARGFAERPSRDPRATPSAAYPGSRGPGAVPPAPPPPSPAIASLIERIRAQQAKSASAGRGTQTPGPKEPARGGPTIAPIAPRRSPSDIAAGAAAARRILGPNPRAGASPQSDTPPSPTPAAPVNSVAALWERAMAAKERREQRDRLLGERIRAKMQGAREGGALGSRPTRLPSEEARERLLKLHGEMMGVAGGGSGGGQRVAAGAVGAGLEEGGEEEGVADEVVAVDSPALDVAFDDAPGPVGWGDGGVREGRRRRGSGASKAKDRVDKASKGGADDMNGRADKSTDAMPVRRGQLRRGMTVRELGSLVGWAMGRVVEVAGGMGEAVMGEEDPLSLECQELVMLEAGVEPLPPVTDAAASHPRPPVVTVMGHVDHGKTSLLDALRKTSVAAGEAGGITQHVGAFATRLPSSGKSITFLDTPGHEAFGNLRRRGAAVGDVVVLAVAADDGVMPQTRESIRLAKELGCAVIVAITKVDVPGADPTKVAEELAGEGVVLDTLGGDVLSVETAAPSGKGIAELEEAVVMQAETMGLRARREGGAVGTVVDARSDRGKGPVAVVVVGEGTLRVGDVVVAGTASGRVRHMYIPGADRAVEEAGPGEAVEVSGIAVLPRPGDPVMVTATEDRAKRIASARAKWEEQRTQHTQITNSQSNPSAPASLIGTSAPLTATNDTSATGNTAKPHAATSPTATPTATTHATPTTPAIPRLPVLVPLILKADVQGSLEALRAMVEGMSTAVVALRVVEASVGPLKSSDVVQVNIAEQGSSSSRGAIVCFNISIDKAVAAQAKQTMGWVTLKEKVIYRLQEKLQSLMSERAPLIRVVDVVGHADVLQTFVAGRSGQVVAGCKVRKGEVRGPAKGCRAFRVLRRGQVVWEGPAKDLRRFKDSVNEVGEGNDCGVLLEGFDAYEVGDVLECVAEVERRMDLHTPVEKQLGIRGYETTV